MGDPRGFLKTARGKQPYRPVAERRRDFAQVLAPWPEEALRLQAARCMDCGVPFCHQGCPLGNRIPDWNDLLTKGRTRAALEQLEATNNFPEFTGTLCPAPCEGACVLGINDQPVQIRAVELALIDRGFAEGWITPRPPARESGAKVAIVGSGPAGLAAAQELRRAGHAVTVFERAPRLGGLMRYGIPEFKFEKRWVDRRLAQLAAEGVIFRPGTNVADVAGLCAEFDAVLLATGATTARDLDLPGRALPGVVLAMDYLSAQNTALEGGPPVPEDCHARGKRVVILGGGDTGADCLGTAHRQQASAVIQLDVIGAPPVQRATDNPWPEWPRILRHSAAHEEGGERRWELRTTAFLGDARVRGLAVEPAVNADGESATLDAELVILALGFGTPDAAALIGGATLPSVASQRYDTGLATVYVAGDARRGQSLIVWAIAEGRAAAKAIDAQLSGVRRLSVVS